MALTFLFFEGRKIQWYHHIYFIIEMKWYSQICSLVTSSDTQSWMFEAMTVPSKLSENFELLFILSVIK